MDRIIHSFDSAAALDLALSGEIHAELNRLVGRGLNPSLAVSGGSTPVGLFASLAKTDLAWDKVSITLTDERCVPADTPQSNENLVRRHLLQEKAAAAAFYPLAKGTETDLTWLSACRRRLLNDNICPFDICILGMGTDGHTASLFPDSPDIAHMMDRNNDDVLHMTHPGTSPYQRITFSRAMLAQSRMVILHIVGDDKKAVLDEALAGSDELAMPIRAFLHDPALKMEIYWAPG